MEKIAYDSGEKFIDQNIADKINNQKITYNDIKLSDKNNKKPTENFTLNRTHNLSNDNIHLNKSHINFYKPDEIKVGNE